MVGMLSCPSYVSQREKRPMYSPSAIMCPDQQIPQSEPKGSIRRRSATLSGWAKSGGRQRRNHPRKVFVSSAICPRGDGCEERGGIPKHKTKGVAFAVGSVGTTIQPRQESASCVKSNGRRSISNTTSPSGRNNAGGSVRIRTPTGPADIQRKEVS
jgi:hypothetical protein